MEKPTTERFINQEPRVLIMKTHKTKMSSNGQVVIPIKIREKTSVKPGMRFLVSVDGESIVLTPVQDSISTAATSEIGGDAGNGIV